MINNFLDATQTFISNWFKRSLFTRDSLYQLIIAVVIFFTTLFLSQLIFKIIKKVNDKIHWEKTDLALPWIKKFIFPTFLYIGLGISKNLIDFLSWKSPVLIGLTTLAGAHLLIKIITNFIEDKFWKRFVSLFIWIISILDVLQLLDAVINFLDSLSVTFGETHISVITLMKGIIFLSVMVCGANFFSKKIEKEIQKSEYINPTAKVIITKTMRIVFFVFAGLVSLRTAGIQLTSFTFLSGAVGVGVGFGLQKVFANLISGFILIMDRSIKPGDVIELDGTFGKIKSLNPRHITLVSLDGKELLVPNEDLITQKVVNWSYSDKFIRLSVLVGVSYNSDVPLVMKLIESATERTKRIIHKKKTVILLKEFSSSSVDIEVKFWISDPENGVENVKSNLRLEIWKSFKENNIEIPFPQQDLHIKTDSILKTQKINEEGLYDTHRYY